MGAPVNSSGVAGRARRSIAEVEAAGAVEGFLRGAGRVAAGQDGLVVVVVAGAVDGEAPAGGGSGVAEPAERQGGAVGELAGDVGGTANSAIAGRLGICQDTARKWRRRYCEQGLDGLADAPRPGRPRRFPARVVAEVKALACELPAASGTPLARWTCPELARHAAASGITTAASASTVRRWLADDALKPWQHRSWIFPRDPHFALKASRVLDLYQREWEGEPVGEDEYVLSADEKPGVQARMRIHLPLPPGPGRAMRAESEYARGGTLACLAAYDVHRARVIGRCEPTTGIKPFTALVDQVMSAEPYASARRVFWVVDNGASHRNWAAAARLSDAYPNAQMVHLPVHASWLNQADLLLRHPAQAPDHRRLRGP